MPRRKTKTVRHIPTKFYAIVLALSLVGGFLIYLTYSGDGVVLPPLPDGGNYTPSRYTNYLQYLFRGDDAVPDWADYWNNAAEGYPNMWCPATSTEGEGMVLECFCLLYNSYPSFINASLRAELLVRAKLLGDQLHSHQFPMDASDVNTRGGFIIHPQSGDNGIYVWGTAPAISGLVALYRVTGNNTHKTWAENGAKWLLRAEDPGSPGRYRNHYDYGWGQWVGSLEMDSACCRALFEVWSITNNQLYYNEGVEAANYLVATREFGWEYQHYSLYAARDGLLGAYMYTHDQTYLDAAVWYEQNVMDKSNRALNYEDAQGARFEYELYVMTGKTVARYAQTGNAMMDYLWADTYFDGEGDYGVWVQQGSSPSYPGYGLSGTIVLWILEAATYKEEQGASYMSFVGDANGDGHVDFMDLSLLASHWYGDMGFGLGYSSVVDFNMDGKIRFDDLSILCSNWGKGPND